jgi:hypothetical protein
MNSEKSLSTLKEETIKEKFLLQFKNQKTQNNKP